MTVWLLLTESYSQCCHFPSGFCLARFAVVTSSIQGNMETAQAGRSLRHLKLSTLRKCLRSVMNPWVWWDSVDAATVFLNSLKSP